MNKQLWISPVNEDQPCGECLEYDNEFLALEQACVGRPEQQYGDTVIPAQAPEWLQVERMADALMTRTKDLRVSLLLIRACTNNYGIEGLAEGLGGLRATLESYWEDVHPQLTVDGEYDPYLRINAIAAIADPNGLLQDLRQAVLVNSAAGALLVRDAVAALGPANENQPFSRDQIASMCAEPSAQPAMAALKNAVDELAAITQLVDARLDAQYPLNISALTNLLQGLANAYVPKPAVDGDLESMPVAAEVSGVVQEAPVRTVAAAPTEIRSRADALKALDAVCAYFEKHEPTSPAPLFIHRAKKLMSANFIDIIKELSPDSMDRVSMITGFKQE